MLAAVADPKRTLFLDVETTGLSRYYDHITLVGFAVDGRYQVHIAGDPPDLLLTCLAEASTLVTFNGTSFDIPFLYKMFGNLPLPKRHIDLRYAAKRAGFAGGQKLVEVHLGLDVRAGVEHITGGEAALLWHAYLRGDTSALRTLIAYNAADVFGMCGILDELVQRLEQYDLLVREPVRFGANRLVPTGRASPGADLPMPARLGRTWPCFSDLFFGTRAARATIVGIDLTGSEAKPSGVCVLRGPEARTGMLRTDDALVTAVLDAKPELVSIDSPLSLPKGRTKATDDDPGRATFGIMRQCERMLKRRGINVYPCLLPSMQRLTERGIRLAQRLRSEGIPVIESYPGAAQDILGIPRKGAGEAWLKRGLAEFGISGPFIVQSVKHDELDAITSALVGNFFLAGKYESLGHPDEDFLVVPKIATAPRQ
jgi:predicted nuclease with RNAse H fold